MTQSISNQSQLPEILLNKRQERDIINDLNNILQGHSNLYLYGTEYACVEECDGKENLLVLKKEHLHDILIEKANYLKIDKNDEVEASTLDKRFVDHLYKNNRHYPRRIKGVVSHPILRKDGKLIYQPGYDPGSQYYVRDIGIDDRNDKYTLKEAWDIIADFIGEFPFKTQADYVNYLALLIQPIVKPVIDSITPLYGIEAPTEGSGKSLLVKLFSRIIFDDDTPAMMTLAENENENRKRITTALMDDCPLIVFDNCNRIHANALNCVLTSKVWKDRKIGYSVNLTLPNEATWVATGNNPHLSREIERRYVTIRLMPYSERPSEGRTFRHPNILADAKEKRAELLKAVLTFVEAWRDQGMPKGEPTMGSFEEWEMIIRGIFKCAKIEGVLEKRTSRVISLDEHHNQMKALFRRWFDEYKSEYIFSKDALKLCQDHDLLFEITVMTSEKSKVTKMGCELKKLNEKCLGDYVLDVKEDKHTGSNKYRLVPVDEYTNRAFDPCKLEMKECDNNQ